MAEWIMVIITTIYVIATIFICIFNYQSARAAKEQTDEMKKQYDDEKRWRMMPFIQVKQVDKVEFVNGNEFCFLKSYKASETTINKKILFEVKNVGHDIAKNIQYEWENDKGGRGLLINSLPVNDKRTIKVLFHAYAHDNYRTMTVLKIRFQDLMGNRYEQEIAIMFEVTREEIVFVNTAIEAPQYIKEQVK